MTDWNLRQVADDWEAVDGRYKEDVFEFMRLHFDALLATALELETALGAAWAVIQESEPIAGHTDIGAIEDCKQMIIEALRLQVQP